jgi:peptide/nickel transport system permease protein
MKKSHKKTRNKSLIWRQFKKNKGAVIGLVVFCVIVVIAIVSVIAFDFDADITAVKAADRLLPPSKEHWFGTDNLGRDVFARVCYGAQYSLLIGVVSVIISVVFGSLVGAFAAFVGGWIETVIMRLIELLLMIPGILLVIMIVYTFGASIPNLMLALGLSTVPHFARNARASVLTVRNNEYIEASRALGASELRVLFKHVLPNAISPILVQATSRISGCIISAAGYSFLGLGVPSPLPEWGAMLSDGRPFIYNYPYLEIFPGLAIMITVLAINQIGDGLRDALDPKLKR